MKKIKKVISISFTALSLIAIKSQALTLENNTNHPIYNAHIAFSTKAKECVDGKDWRNMGSMQSYALQSLPTIPKLSQFVLLKFQTDPSSNVWYSAAFTLSANTKKDELLKVNATKMTDGQMLYSLNKSLVYFSQMPNALYTCTLENNDIATDSKNKTMDMKFTFKGQRYDYHALLEHGTFKINPCTELYCGVPTLYFEVEPESLIQSSEKPTADLEATVSHSSYEIFGHRFEYQKITKKGERKDQEVMEYQGNSYIDYIKPPLAPAKLSGYLSYVDTYKTTYRIGTAGDDLHNWSFKIHNLTDVHKNDIICSGHTGKQLNDGELIPPFTSAFSIESTDEDVLMTQDYHSLYRNITASAGLLTFDKQFEWDSFGINVGEEYGRAELAFGEKTATSPLFMFELKHVKALSGNAPKPMWMYKDVNVGSQPIQCFFI